MLRFKKLNRDLNIILKEQEQKYKTICVYVCVNANYVTQKPRRKTAQNSYRF